MKWQRQLSVVLPFLCCASLQISHRSLVTLSLFPFPLCTVPFIQGHQSKGPLNMKSHNIVFAKSSFQELWLWIQHGCNYLQHFCFPFIDFTMNERNLKCLHIYLMFWVQMALTDLFLIYSRFWWCPMLKTWGGLNSPLSCVWGKYSVACSLDNMWILFNQKSQLGMNFRVSFRSIPHKTVITAVIYSNQV